MMMMMMMRTQCLARVGLFLQQIVRSVVRVWSHAVRISNIWYVWIIIYIYIYVLCCTLIYTFQTLSNLVCHYRERTRQWQGLDQVLTGRCTITSKAVRSAKVNFRTISSHGDAQGAHPVKGPIAFPFTNSIYVEAHGTNSIMVAEDLALFCLLLPYSTLTGLFLRYSPPYLRPHNCHVS